MGAQWCGDALARAGLADDAICPFCREAKDGFRHRWWQFPVFEHIHDRDGEFDVFVSECPPPDCLLLHGVCPAFGAGVEGPLWA
eukprot:11096198-Lingulodinium_polyedra.AAC.1